VSLSFSYVRSGKPSVVEVERRWTRKGQTVTESLNVRQDGVSPNIGASDYQTYLNDLVPTGTAPLCFFDAETLDALTLPERRGGALLGDTLRRLLGLDLVERLQDDLTYYTTRQGGSKKIEKLRKEILEHQKSLEEFDALISQLEESAESLEEERAELETALERQEQQLASEGGTYAARRPMLQERLTKVAEEIETVAEELRELSSGLLPFALVPQLCRTLADKLTHEAKLYRQNVAGELLRERFSDVESVLQSDEVWRDLNIPEEARETLSERLSRLMREAGPSVEVDEQTSVHNLAEPEHNRLRDWIAQALHSVPKQAEFLGGRLQKLKAERRSIEKDLRRAPEDEALAPIHAEIERLQKSLGELQQRQKQHSEKLGAFRYQREDRARQHERVGTELQEAQAGERQTGLAERSKTVLRSYQDSMTRQRLTALETALVESFNAVCHKEHLLGAASINPDNFEVRLEGIRGRVVSIEYFSAGEQQLYALAMLRALRLVSKRNLPLAIDTPVARLDEAHRDRFIHRYVPEVSDQVLLFATDVEMDAETLEQTEPYLARVYDLDYDEDKGKTQIATSGPLADDHHRPAAVGVPAVKEQDDADL
jgi:DNA sulfur modification protein DndD